MGFDGRTARRFTARNVAYAGVGLASLITPVPAAYLFVVGGPGAALVKWLLLASPALGLVGLVLNIRGLIRIREGQAGGYDLVLTWPGFLGAAFTCLCSLVVLLTWAAA